MGAPIAGRLSDRILVKWRKRRAGVWVPEDRLRASLLGAGALVPLSMLFFGIILTYVRGNLGIVLALAVLFMNGIGVRQCYTQYRGHIMNICEGRFRSDTYSSIHCRYPPSSVG